MCDYCSWIEKILRPKIEDLPTVCTNILNGEEEAQSEPKILVKKYVPTILVHGTADSVATKEEISSALERIEKAAIEAYKELAKGCEAVEAVELAILNLESTELNADSGEPANMLKENNSVVIRDAAIMDSDSNAGSFGAAIHTIHPITKAKSVLKESIHVLIVESGIQNVKISSNDLAHADKFNEMLPIPPNSRMSTEEIDVTKKNKESNLSMQKGVRLYGAVTRDRKGRLACGISTMDDREESIAKSSMTASGTVLGCGIFANAKSCCSVSSEDHAIYLYAPARKIAETLHQEKASTNELIKIEDVLNSELTNFFRDTGESCIGAAALTLEGEPKVAFTSQYFPWACCNDGIITSGYIKRETFEKDVGELGMPLDCRCD